MESAAAQIALYAVATWTWVWLLRVTRRDLPLMIYVRHQFGLQTPRRFYWLADLWPWLTVGGLMAVGVAGLVPVARAGVAVGLLATAVGLLTDIQRWMARLFDPQLWLHS